MGLNIDTEEASRLAEELARVTGESLTDAVTTALRERLERLRRKGEDADLLERLRTIVDDCAPRWKEPFRSTDHGDLLYDDKGLPI